MEKNHRAASALISVFPTHETYRRYWADGENRKPLESLIAFAARNEIIPAADEDALEEWIRDNAGSTEARKPPNHFKFEDLFEQKEALLELNLSARALSDRINALITEHRIDLPKLSNSMLSRLKKEAADTPHKQNVLRSLAFWLGYDRSHLVPQWNYETLLMLCREGKQSADHKEGVRIGFALYSRGDVIDHDIMGWLKRELKRYIETAIGRFSYGRWGKVRSHDITTLYVDFPKEQKAGNPAAYRQCLRSAVSLAHQMAIRWALSDHFSQNRFLSIGIAAGDFAGLDNHLIPTFNAKLPGDPVIRLTDYARQCVLINDIRALLCSRPAEITLLNGETLTIWWVTGFWSTLYFDFVPDLLDDPILGTDSAAISRLAGSLWPSVTDDAAMGVWDGANAISTFFRFPHNSLLGLEIAKTLYFRRRFWEALEILRIVLSLDPIHLNARTLRMVLLRNLALDASSYKIAEGLFRQSYHEADYIQRNCAYQSEDFYCEYAVVYLAQAMLALRYIRAGKGVIAGVANGRAFAHKIFDWLDRAEDLFGLGMMVSPSGIRSIYLLNTVRVLKAVLANDEKLLSDPDRPIDGAPDTIRETCKEFQWQLGYLREDLPQKHPYEQTEKIFKLITLSHDDSIALQAYRPTTYFCTAIAWWDLFPERTVDGAKLALQLLKDAAGIAREIEKKEVCIYSFTRTYGEMMPVSKFIAHIDRSVRMIEDQCGGNLNTRDGKEIIEPKADDRMSLLMTLNF